MGKKSVRCFSWYKRRKDCRKGPPCPAPPAPSVDEQTPLPHSLSWAGSGQGGVQVCLSHKARVACRHQMDGNVIDATC